MTTRYAAKFGPNFQNTLNALARFESFNAGNLRGERATLPAWSLGGTQLPDEWRKQFREDAPIYVVFSYGTPIAWVAKRGGEWVTVIPPVKYSSSTSAHQGVARRGLGEYTEELHS